MAGLGDLIIRLLADTSEFESDMGKAAHVAEREMERMVTRATVMGNVIGQAIGAAATHFSNLVQSTLKMGDELAKLSQRTGQSVERLSELRFAGELADVSFSQLQTGLGFFNKALVDAQNESSKTGQVFKALGVDINAGPQEAFNQFARAINTLPDGEAKVAAMRAAFGRAGDALIPMMSGMDDASEKARRLGIVMSEQLARDSERLNDAMVTLSASSRSLAITALAPAASGAATFAEALVTARERGEGLKGVFVEINKVLAATIADVFPAMGKAMDDWGRQVDRAMERGRTRPITGPDGKPVAGPDVRSPAEVACAASGGKWDGQQCVYKPAAKGRKPRDDSDFVARQLQFGADEEARIQTEINDILGKRQQLRNEEDEAQRTANLTAQLELIDRQQALEIEMSEIIVRNSKSQTQLWIEEQEKIAKQGEKTARELGLVFVSAAEESLRKWEGMGKLLKSIATDIAQIVFRKAVTEPLGAAVSGIFKDGNIIGRLSNAISGTQAPAPVSDAVAVPSYDVGTDYVPHDMIAKVHRGEAIIPAAENTGGARGGGVTIVQTNNIDSRSDRAEIARALEASRRRTLADIQELMLRGVVRA
jgi:post-segregation antitoxin (ccd killing protein)